MGRVWGLALTHSKLIVLMALADHANDEGGNIYPSMSTVAWKTGYSSRQVQRIISEMADEGILVTDGFSQYDTRIYRIDFEKVTVRTRLEKGKKRAPKIPSNPPYDILSGGDILSENRTSGTQNTLVLSEDPPEMSPEPSFKPSFKPILPSRKAKAEKPIDPRHAPLIKSWTESYEQQHGRKPVFKGRDFKAAAELLKQATPERILEVSAKAWRRQRSFFSRNAASLTGLYEKWNEISSEIDQPETNSRGELIPDYSEEKF